MADALQISCDRLLVNQGVLRSDLASIFRGQALTQSRNGASWYPTYLFVGSDGEVGLRCSPKEFTAQGLAQFAQWLQVPIRGDFSTRVKERLEPQPVQ